MLFKEIQDTCFFRYRKVNDNTIKELELGQIWHSRYEYLNDPFEFPFFYDIEAFTESELEEFFELHMPQNRPYLEEMKRLKLDNSVYKQIKYWIQKNMEKVFEYQKHACVACFCGNPYDGLMWSHYADELKGICIAYNKERLQQEKHFQDITPINYNDDVGLVTFRDLVIKSPKKSINPWPEYLIKEKIILPATSTTGHIVDLVLNTQDFSHAMQKHKRWRYEDESRCVVFPESEDRAKTGVVIEAGTDIIDAIIIGEKALEEDFNKTLAYTKKHSLLLFVAKANKRTYQVDIEIYN